MNEQYCILNTDRNIVIKRANGRSTFRLEDAEEWLDQRDDPSHLEIRKLVEP